MSQPRLSVLIALIDRIIPKDDYPSASENGVVNFIANLLSGDLKDRAQEVVAGLDSLNEESLAAHGRGFVELTDAQKDALLLQMDEEEDFLAVWPIAPARFFSLMVRLTNEGYYADPGNGANVEGISWRMVGYEPRVPDVPARERWLGGD